jgi:hypothetical protein
MSNASSTHARSAPASVCLLAEHLDAVLAAGEDLVGIRYVWSGAPPRQRDAILALRAGQRATIERIRLVELALLSRLIKAREWASVVAREREGLGLIARLYVGGTTTLVDAIAECADTTASDFDTGDDLTAYVRGRGLIAEDAPALSDSAPICVDESFLVARRAQLGVLLDLVATFLDALEGEFELFAEPPRQREQASSPPAVAR